MMLNTRNYSGCLDERIMVNFTINVYRGGFFQRAVEDLERYILICNLLDRVSENKEEESLSETDEDIVEDWIEKHYHTRNGKRSFIGYLVDETDPEGIAYELMNIEDNLHLLMSGELNDKEMHMAEDILVSEVKDIKEIYASYCSYEKEPQPLTEGLKEVIEYYNILQLQDGDSPAELDEMVYEFFEERKDDAEE